MSGALQQRTHGGTLLLGRLDNNPYADRLNIGLGRRALAIFWTLLAALALLGLLINFGPTLEKRGQSQPIKVVTIDAPQAQNDAPETAESQPETSPSPQEQAPTPERPLEPTPPVTPQIITPPPPVLPPINPTTAPPAPAPPPPRAAPAQVYGPPDRRRSGASQDTARIGTAPNGEPMYAAAWYREPTDAELRGYLSTADGPGWGLIACRTAPDFRVEDCVAVDEYPAGSRMNRAILAAAWQFRVRPPRQGGRVMVGSWVGIRIDMRDRGR